MTFGCGCDWTEPCAALRKKCDMRLRLRLGRALRCAALRKKITTCDCDCDWA
jgi:hypothetical protein